MSENESMGTVEIATHQLVQAGIIPVQNLPSVGPYTWVSYDQQVVFTRKGKAGRAFRVLIYGAYNAMGLIGSEGNGIVILDEDKMLVLTDQISAHDSGYFGPTKAQIAQADALTAMTWAKFRAFVNSHPRSRYTLT